MGYSISTIKNLPTLSGFYFFLIGKESHARGMSDTALYKHFDEIAYRIGDESAIVKSTNSERISDELVNSFMSAPWFREVYDEFLYKTPSLIIMQPHPNEFKFKDNDFFALIPFETLDRVYLSESDLIKDIVALAIKGSLDIIKKVSECTEEKGVLKRLGKSLLLQPNFSGIGIDIKELFHSKPYNKSFIYEKNKPQK